MRRAARVREVGVAPRWDRGGAAAAGRAPAPPAGPRGGSRTGAGGVRGGGGAVRGDRAGRAGAPRHARHAGAPDRAPAAAAASSTAGARARARVRTGPDVRFRALVHSPPPRRPQARPDAAATTRATQHLGACGARIPRCSVAALIDRWGGRGRGSPCDPAGGVPADREGTSSAGGGGSRRRPVGKRCGRRSPRWCARSGASAPPPPRPGAGPHRARRRARRPGRSANVARRAQ